MIDYKLNESLKLVNEKNERSFGATTKYFHNNYWYKENMRGSEGQSEEICSIMLKNSNLSNYVTYEECLINGISGCRSKNMLSTDKKEDIVTLAKLHTYIYGTELKHILNSYLTTKEKIEYVLDFVFENTKVDIYNYLGKILKFDMLTYDVDRHFNNLALIKGNEGFREAPMFDFGGAFFSMQHVFKKEMSLEDKINKMTPQPFSTSFEEQADFFKKVKIEFDYNKIKKELAAYPEEIKEIVFSNMEKYKKEFSKKEIPNRKR